MSNITYDTEELIKNNYKEVDKIIGSLSIASYSINNQISEVGSKIIDRIA